MKPRNRRAGVTQLEVILALTLMTMAGLALASFLGSAQGALIRTKERSALVSQAQNRLDLRRWAENIPLRFGDGTAVDFVQGSKKDLILTARQPGSTEALQRLKIGLDLQTKDLTLYATRGEIETTHILATAPQNLSISYYGRTEFSSDPTWHETWLDPQYYPRLIKIEWVNRYGAPAAPITLRPAYIDRQNDRSRENLLPQK